MPCFVRMRRFAFSGIFALCFFGAYGLVPGFHLFLAAEALPSHRDRHSILMSQSEFPKRFLAVSKGFAVP